MNLRIRFHQLAALSQAEQRDLLRAVVALLVVRMALALLGFDRSRRWLLRRRQAPRPVLPQPPWEEAERQTRMVNLAARRGPIRAACLAQSLAACWLLDRRGFRPELRIGARRASEGGIEAHAWLELNGTVLVDAVQVRDRFAVLATSSGSDLLGQAPDDPTAH
jgi:hypothetical protein